ncbi:MAG: DUF4124 domain-containing protein [Woeseiaceae bacterium]|nr:DUF4124 domain-containing protein [Woeseiaceae bacterium]
MDTRACLALLGILAAGLAVAAGAYRWVDEEGVVHYSDVPREGADYVDLSGYSATTGARIGPQRDSAQADAAQPAPADQPFEYQSIEIVSPAAEETLWNIEGTLNVSLALQPGLQEGHQVRVYFDGEPRLVAGTSFTIDEVWRGVHNIQAEVIDATGRLMIRSQPNRFYVQQNSIIQRRPVP